MDNPEYIDNYFTGGRSEEEKLQFEKRIVEDPAFAAEVAFYITANGLIKTEQADGKKQRFRELFDQQKQTIPLNRRPVMGAWTYLAAASLAGILIIFAWFFLNKNDSPPALADKYLQQQWQTIGVTMSTKQDSLQAASNLYNSKDYAGALAKLENILRNDPVSPRALQYAGLAALQLGAYDKSIAYFGLLANDTTLRSNYGVFLTATTLMKRNGAGDKTAAKTLLQKVVTGNLEGKSAAIDWLKKID